jgi:hypothetical protein
MRLRATDVAGVEEALEAEWKVINAPLKIQQKFTKKSNL